MKRQLFWGWIAVVSTVHVANVYTAQIGLQLEMSWLDMPLHFFGGVGVGLFALWLGILTGILPYAHCKTWLARRMHVAFPEIPWWWSMGLTLAVVAIVGLAWEVFEIFLLDYFNFPIPEGYTLDTLKDLVMDTLGALVAWAAFHRVQCKAWQEAKATGETAQRVSM